MITVRCKLESISYYSQSRHYDVPALEREKKDDYEKRTWRERCNTNEAGNIFIPPMAFKNCITDAAQYLSIKIKGSGTSTYTKHFVAGILCVEGLDLGIKKDDVEGEWHFVPSDGKVGGGKRVNKCFPLIRKWSGEVEYIILDEIITEDIFTEVLAKAGQFIGIGRFRPQRRGYYGRFVVKSIKWIKS